MTLSVRGAFQDMQITPDEAKGLVQDAAARANRTAATPEQLQKQLTTHFKAEGMSDGSAALAAERIADAYAHGGPDNLQTATFEPEGITFAPLPAAGDSPSVSRESTTGAGAGYSGLATAKTPEARMAVYDQITTRMSARLGGASDWSALGSNACRQVATDTHTIHTARGALKDLMSGKPEQMTQAIKVLHGLSEQDSAIGRAVGVFMKSAKLTPVELAKAGLSAAATALLPVLAVKTGADLLQGLKSDMTKLDSDLGRLEGAFNEGNGRIYQNIAEAYDQYDRGGAAAVTNPELHKAFELTAKAEKTSDPAERKQLLHDSTMMIARFEQTLIQPQFDIVADVMDAVPDVRWTPPGASASTSLGTGSQWRDRETRLGIIEKAVVPRFGM